MSALPTTVPSPERPSPEVITHLAAVELVASMLLRREGEVLTQALAFERSRNIIQALAGMEIAP
jgi:hypothetical protein